MIKLLGKDESILKHLDWKAPRSNLKELSGSTPYYSALHAAFTLGEFGIAGLPNMANNFLQSAKGISVDLDARSLR